MSLLDWPDVLRAAGIAVRTLNGWPNTPMPKGAMPNRLAGVFWHHDGSTPGSTPGSLQWITDTYNAGKPSAQVWVSYSGTWHFVGAGYASHAGVVRGPLSSANCPGVETDHTTGEPMNPALLESMRRGFAAICRHEGRRADFVTFHKIEAFPRGRKPDPYFTADNQPAQWDAELARERAAIQALIDGAPMTPAAIQEDEDDMPTLDEIRKAFREELRAEAQQETWPDGQLIPAIRKQVNQGVAEVAQQFGFAGAADPGRLAGAIAEAVVAAGRDMTREQVEEVVSAALRDAAAGVQK